MTTVGPLVLAVAEAAAQAQRGGVGHVDADGDSVNIVYHPRASRYVVASASLFSDGHLARRVEALLRHAPRGGTA